MKRFGLSMVIRFALATIGAAQAEEQMRLTEEQAVEMALENHPSVLASAAARDIALAEVAEAEARFAPSLQAQALHATDRAPSVSSLEQVTTATTNYQTLTLGVVKPLKTGGRVLLSVDQNRTSDNAAFRTINPVYGTSVRMELRQPLARGRGRVNRTGVEIAEAQHAASLVAYEARRRDVEADARNAYWDLFLARANLQVKRQLLEGAERVLETVQSRVEAGSEAESAILQARAGLAVREEDAVIAEDAVRDREDRLVSLLGVKGDPGQGEVIPVDTPTVHALAPDLETGTHDALALSDRYAEALARTRIHQVEVARTRDALRPSMDLSLSAELKGLGSSVGDPWHGLRDGEGHSWNGGVSFAIPLGASVEDTQLSRHLWEKSQAELELAEVELEIVREARELHRQMQTNLKRVEASRLAEQLAEQNVQEAEERLALGMATARDVLDIQDDLAEAHIRHMTAVVDSQKAEVAWYRRTGSRLPNDE